MKNFFKISLSIAVIGLLLNACKKDDDFDEQARIDANETFHQEQLIEETTDIADEVTMMQLEGVQEQSTLFSRLGPCVTITHDSTTSPKSILVDWGAVGCVCRDGKFRKGAILITYTGKPRLAGTIITLTPQQYFVNNYGVQGLKTITNVSANNTTSINVQVINGIITNPQGQSATVNSNITRKFLAGQNTLIRADDVYEITGTRSRITYAGNTVTVSTNKPLVKDMSCRWFLSGELELAFSGRRNRVLNYGNGSCDDQATVSVGNITRTITLP